MSTFQGTHSIAHSVYERHQVKSNRLPQLVAAITLVVYSLLNAHVYDGLNKGIVIDFPLQYSVGLEIQGDPGFFICSGDC